MTRLFDSAYVAALAREESVRGVLVRRVKEEAVAAENDEELVLLENALELLLTRFQAMDGEAS
jgi:hypothetical protein